MFKRHFSADCVEYYFRQAVLTFAVAMQAGPESQAYMADEAAVEPVHAAAIQQAASTYGRDERL